MHKIKSNQIKLNLKKDAGIGKRTAHLIQGIHEMLLVPVLVRAPVVLISDRCRPDDFLALREDEGFSTGHADEVGAHACPTSL